MNETCISYVIHKKLEFIIESHVKNTENLEKISKLIPNWEKIHDIKKIAN